MRWIALSACLVLAGCGGLERKQYPASANAPLMIGTVEHVQHYEGDASESEWSRLGLGALAGGVIVGAAAALADPGEHTFEAYSYLVKPVAPTRQAQLFNAFDGLEVGDCVAVYKSVREGMNSLSKLEHDQCSDDMQGGRGI
ncbi:hypothetical protein [Halomonas smyrnensis]|uniref:hypothetical protein n=1 Tax=Halomonas smyrnensis TaxID=720605 RepID=UPI0012E9C5D4|nr:hypothetical protein [Halomonas smyrnensis]